MQGFGQHMWTMQIDRNLLPGHNAVSIIYKVQLGILYTHRNTDLFVTKGAFCCLEAQCYRSAILTEDYLNEDLQLGY